MNYLRSYKIFEAVTIQESILDELETDERWISDTNLMDHWAYKYDHTLPNGYVLSIIGMKKERDGVTMILYINFDDKLNMVDYVIDPYNMLFRWMRREEILDWCIKIGEEQSQYFIERETLPTEDELRDTFIELSEDMGYVLESINYGYTNVPFPKPKSEFDGKTLFEVDENPYWNKNHKSSEHTKLVMYYEQPRGRGLEVSMDELKEQFNHLKKRLDIFGYKVKCEMYFTQTRYYSGEHRPEDFIIVIENTRLSNRIRNRQELKTKKRINESIDTSTIDTINDICEDLRDDGYEVKVEQNTQTKRTYEYKRRFYIQGGFITVTVNKQEDYLDGYTLVPFSFVKVKETFIRMINYMKLEGYDQDLCYYKSKMGGGYWESFSGKDDSKHDSYQITFFKKTNIE